MSQLSIRTVRDENASTVVLSLTGILDSQTYPRLERRLVQLGESCPFVILEVRKVETVGIDAWSGVLAALRPLREGGGDLTLVGMAPAVREVYDLLQLAPLIEAFESVSEARSAVQQV